jgi:hypothetical protein
LNLHKHKTQDEYTLKFEENYKQVRGGYITSNYEIINPKKQLRLNTGTHKDGAFFWL